MKKKREIMDNSALQRALNRISYEILERNDGIDDVCVLGIVSGGVSIGKMIADKLSDLEGRKVFFGYVDIKNFRDDIYQKDQQNLYGNTSINFSIENKKIILVDDVIYTGRSSRAAMDEIISMGRPKMIQLAVLIDRGHRELPIRPDYVGKNVPTSKDEAVIVEVDNFDYSGSVTIYNIDKLEV